MRLALFAFVAACHVGSQASDAGPANTLDITAYPLRMNPILQDGHVVVMGGAEGCHGIAADVDVHALMAAIDKSESMSCELMSDPAWQTCRFGEVYAKADHSDCICRVGGKEPKTMACPKPAAK